MDSVESPLWAGLFGTVGWSAIRGIISDAKHGFSNKRGSSLSFSLTSIQKISVEQKTPI